MSDLLHGQSRHPFGVCQDCGKTVTLRKDGALRAHRSRGFRCIGSGGRPYFTRVAR